MEFQSYLSQKYQGHESFLENIIFPIFGEDNYETSYDVELLDSDELRGQAVRTGIRSIIRCGTIDIDLNPIEVFDITVSDRILMDRNRVGVQAVIRRVMDTYSGAFMIFHYDNDVKWDWRFTFCQMKDKGEFTDNKRYTFLLGPNQSCRTAAQNFQKLADLHEVITIKDIVSAFDVEALSKAFFDGYKRHYERFVEFITGKRFEKEGGKFVEKASHKPHSEYYPAFGRNDKAVRDYTKLLLARIVFLHFLQKKGWLGVPVGGQWGDGDEQFMKHLYEKASAKQKDDFLESVLEPLFFDALNCDRTGSKDVFDTKVVGDVRIPYLNGGLFSRDSLDDVSLRYPKEFFGDFFEFLYQYNFTIDENDPNEAQVGIDPERLGKIFENLLEDNKDKGAFYTPKEIVQYMCQESLVAYLETRTGYGDERLRTFVKDPFVRVSEFTPDEQYAILGAILNVKICDPAIGSGAFPIGLLNELVRCKEAIYGDEKGRAEIKKEIIRDNIYGVDIEKGAVDIARLRFWLSLIVDEEEPLPLPNLDFKIMQGNSLLEWYEGVDLSHLVEAGETDIFLSGAEDLKDDLAKSLKKYFDESNLLKKQALKAHVSETISKIFDVAGVDIPEGIDVAENNRFFLWHTWFNEVFADGGGFDIVIGNPPYISIQGMPEPMRRLYKARFLFFYHRYDLFGCFIEQGLRLLASNGILTFIQPSVFLNSKSFTYCREHLVKECSILRIDLLKDGVFDSAIVPTMIMSIANRKPMNQEIICSQESLKKNYIIDQQCFNNTEAFVFNINLDKHTAMFIEKTQRDCRFLGEIARVSNGINTGNLSAYIHEKKLPHTVPVIKGGSISKWDYEFHGYYLDDKFSQFVSCGDLDALSGEKLMMKRIGIVPNVCYDNKGIACLHTIHTIRITDSSFSPKYVMAVLNSKLLGTVFRLRVPLKGDVFPEFRVFDLNQQMPIHIASKKQQAPIIALVDKILAVKKDDKNADTSVWEAEIDRLVYDLYGVPEEERK